MSNNAKPTTNNPFDIFVIGARKGWQIAINNLLPNVLMAYVIAEILNLVGAMQFIGRVFGPMMGVFGLPGEAVTVLLTTWLSSSAGTGVAVSLISKGILNGTHASILIPALFLWEPSCNTWVGCWEWQMSLKSIGRCSWWQAY